MSKITKYQIEVTYFTPHPQKHVIDLVSAGEVDNWLSLPSKVDIVLFIAALGGGVDYGNFYLFLNKEDAAHIWLHEHREYIPVERHAYDDGTTVTFRYEDGETFDVSVREVLSRTRALEALHYWLSNQDQFPLLEWL
ncbi:MAG TPA: hypothetical protein PKJ84_08875 [Anaerolineales bacterium]|nr:hypothetical protein [Anaerolineales bacterium]